MEKEFKKAVILLDNASSHKTDVLKAWAKETGVVLVFNVPYFSKANPIELFFSDLKSRCRDVNTTNHQELAEEVVKKTKTIPRKNFESYFRKAFRDCQEKFLELLKEEEK